MRKKKITAGVVSAAISIVILTILNGLNPGFYIIITGAFTALFMLMFALRIPLPRFYLLAAWTIVVTGLTYVSSLALSVKMSLLLSGTGIGLLLSGILALVFYLKNTVLLDGNQAGD